MKDEIIEILKKYGDHHIDYDTKTCYQIIPVHRFKEIANDIIEITNKIIDENRLDDKITITTLEAKVYAYEKIIANSNFKTILEDKDSKGK